MCFVLIKRVSYKCAQFTGSFVNTWCLERQFPSPNPPPRSPFSLTDFNQVCQRREKHLLEHKKVFMSSSLQTTDITSTSFRFFFSSLGTETLTDPTRWISIRRPLPQNITLYRAPPMLLLSFPLTSSLGTESAARLTSWISNNGSVWILKMYKVSRELNPFWATYVQRLSLGPESATQITRRISNSCCPSELQTSKKYKGYTPFYLRTAVWPWHRKCCGKVYGLDFQRQLMLICKQERGQRHCIQERGQNT